jgi:hypothetical protein
VIRGSMVWGGQQRRGLPEGARRYLFGWKAMPFARDDLDSNCRRSVGAGGRGELATCLGQHGWGGCHGGGAGAAAAPGARETASMGRARAADRAEEGERRTEDGAVLRAVLLPVSSCVLAKCSMCPRRKCGSGHARTGPARLPPSPASRDGERTWHGHPSDRHPSDRHPSDRHAGHVQLSAGRGLLRHPFARLRLVDSSPIPPQSLTAADTASAA